MVQYIKEERLQIESVKNFAATVVTGLREFKHITPALMDFNWRRLSSMLKYTVGIFTFKCEGTSTLIYLFLLCH